MSTDEVFGNLGGLSDLLMEKTPFAPISPYSDSKASSDHYAFIIGEKFIDSDNVCLILGDNIFHSDTFVNKYLVPSFSNVKPTVLGYHVKDPERYGVVEFYKYLNVYCR